MSKVETEVRQDPRQRAVRTSAKPTRGAGRARSGAGQDGTGPTPPPAAPSPAVTLVGREPRVDLLPTEVHDDRRERAVARRAWLGVIVLAAVVLLVIGGATVQSIRSGAELSAAQSETTSLLLEQQKYSEVRTLESQTTLLQSAQTVGGSTEIDWSSVLGQLATSLPSGVTITSMTVASTNPTTAFAQGTSPLAAARVASIAVSVSSPSLPSVPDWTDRLAKLPGYADSSIGSINRASDGTAYTAQISVDLNEKAYDKKYGGDSK